MSKIERMVRITIEQMTEPRDVMLAQVEVAHSLVFDDLTGEVLESYAEFNGQVIVDIPYNAAELQRHLKTEQMEALYDR
ncbi:MAG: hypothetical protein WCA85_25975 [Paraburkholderia sp.]|uniref:hypothetical protein n=1 Tax=Paraburkholderia sp. TaxID=1926495 RepID=UPI003C62C9DC